MSSRAFRISIALAASIVAAAAPASAQEPPVQLGGVVGPNFSQLSGPKDPEGEVTVLGGTAFTGLGVTGGATFALPLLDVPAGVLHAELDALYSHQRATGFAESRTTDARRELTLIANMLRVPLFVRYDIVEDPLSIRFGAGPELLFGFASQHSTFETGTDAPGGSQDTFDTTSATHLGLTGKLGVTFGGAGFRVPVDLRFTWDPFVPASTRDRLVGFQSFEDPGKYQVAFDFQVMAMVGVEFDLSLGGGGGSRSASRLKPTHIRTRQRKNERVEPPGVSPPSPFSRSTTASASDETAVADARDTLWADCREDPDHDRCATPDLFEAGAFGSGPAVGALPGEGARMTDGFVDYATGELIVGATFDTDREYGYVVAIDLESGNRRLISGRHDDETSGALLDVGDGPPLGAVFDVEAGPDDALYAFHSPVDGARVPNIVRIDPETGDREVVWGADEERFGQCRAGDRTILPAVDNFAIGSGGEFYVVSSNRRPDGSGWGLLSIEPDGSECHFVSLAGSDHGSDTGSGPAANGGALAQLEMIGGTLWGTHPQDGSVWAFNPSGGGERKRIAAAHGGEVPLGVHGLTWVPQAFMLLTAGGEANGPVLSLVDPLSGDRKSVVDVMAGPMEGGNWVDSPTWLHPSGRLSIHIVGGEAVVFFDPRTGASNIVSM